jgi:hypothetical protein
VDGLFHSAFFLCLAHYYFLILFSFVRASMGVQAFGNSQGRNWNAFFQSLLPTFEGDQSLQRVPLRKLGRIPHELMILIRRSGFSCTDVDVEK